MALNTIAFILFLAQVGYPGGQYPGQYPPGQYPGGTGGGIPIPGRGKKTTSSTKKDPSVTSVSFRGVVRTVDSKSLEIEAEDSRFIIIQINDKTKRPKELLAGDSVEVSAQEDGNGGFIADSVKKLDEPVKVIGGSRPVEPSTDPAKAGEKEEALAASEKATTLLNGPKYDADDDGPPTLKRGAPAPRKKPREDAEVAAAPKPAETSVAAPVAAPIATQPVSATTNPRQAFMERAKEQGEGFLTGLPNYVCQEYTTRYVSEGKSGWHAVDVVSLELLYVDGKEDYRNIAINGKPWKKPVEESGAWSTGEFGTVLRDLYSPATAAEFKYIKDSTASGFPAHIYDFKVDRAHSHWKVTIVSQSIYPSYKGSIWLDKSEARPLRIEMQATNIPPDFPEDSVESAVDYGYVSLGTQKFFVPLKAEVLSCHRGSSVCDRNVIEFRNYHKYTGESEITFK